MTMWAYAMHRMTGNENISLPVVIRHPIRLSFCYSAKGLIISTHWCKKIKSMSNRGCVEHFHSHQIPAYSTFEYSTLQREIHGNGRKFAAVLVGGGRIAAAPCE